MSSGPAPADAGYARRVVFDYTVPQTGGVTDVVLRRQSGLTGQPRGGYELVGPVVTKDNAFVGAVTPGADDELCNTVPADEEAGEGVDTALEPEPGRPAEPGTGCEEIGELNIPLEAELHDDFTDVESFWRTALATAESASLHADELGQQHVAEGLAVDSRAEIAQRELAALCGVNVDLSSLFANDLSDVIGGPCSGGCASGYECIGSTCVLSLEDRINAISDDDRTTRILQACLGEGTVEPLVALGNTDLCVWQTDGDASVICDPDGRNPADPGLIPQPCPFRRTGTSCSSQYTPNSGYTVVEVPVKLGFFDSTRHDGSETGGRLGRRELQLRPGPAAAPRSRRAQCGEGTHPQ